MLKKNRSHLATQAAVFSNCASILGGLVLATLSTPACQAGDFTHVKQIYVPPSRISRRYDDDSVKEEFQIPPSGDSGGSYSSGSAAGSGSGAGSGKPGGRYGLIPPPPPLSPSTLPSSLLPSSSGSGNGMSYTIPKVNSGTSSANTPAKAAALARSGNLEQAQQMLKTYVKNSPKDLAAKASLATISLQRAQQFYKENNMDFAAKNARDALAAQPSNTAAKNLLTQILSKTGMNSESAEDRLKLGENLLAQGRTSEAAVEFQSALKLKPSADALVGLGDVAMRDGKKDVAKSNYQHALELQPNCASALRQLGMLRYSQSDVIGANSDLSRALVLNPGDKVASKQLIELWQRQVARAPSEVNGHMGLARAYQLSNDLKSAQAEYRQVVRLDPNNANLPAARQSFKLALARQDAQKAMEAAHGLETQGLMNDAHQKVLEAVSLCPADVSTRLYQGKISQKLGLYNEAHEAYMNVLHQDPQNAEATEGLRSLPPVNAPSTVSTQTAPPVAPPPNSSMAMPDQQPQTQSQSFIGRNPTIAAQDEGILAGAAALAQPQSTGASSLAPTLAGLAPAALAGMAPSLMGASTATYPAVTSAAASPALSATSSAPSLGASPSGGAPSAPSLFPTTDTGPAIAQGELPPAANIPTANIGPTASHTTNLSNFLTGVRNVALAQRESVRNAESAMRSAISGNSDEDPPLGSLPGLSGGSSTSESLSSLPSVDSSSMNDTLSQAQAALKAAGVKPSSSTAPATASATPTTGSSTALSGSASQAAMYATSASTSAANAAIPPGATSNPLFAMAMQAFPQLGPAQNANLANMMMQVAPQLQYMSPQDISKMYSRYRGALERQLGVKLPKQVQFAPPGTASQAASPATAAASASGYGGQNPVAATGYGGTQAAQGYASAPPSVSATPAYSPSQLGLRPEIPTAATPLNTQIPNSQMANLSGALRPPISAAAASAGRAASPVKMELEGVSPTPTNINLRVVLKNNQSVPMTVPADTKAIINMNGKQKIAKISFGSKKIPPGGELHGTIKVPGHDLSPAADLFLPNVLTEGAEHDLHLTVPASISSL